MFDRQAKGNDIGLCPLSMSFPDDLYGSDWMLLYLKHGIVLPDADVGVTSCAKWMTTVNAVVELLNCGAEATNQRLQSWQQ
jgi:hypothetical protein